MWLAVLIFEVVAYAARLRRTEKASCLDRLILGTFGKREVDLVQLRVVSDLGQFAHERNAKPAMAIIWIDDNTDLGSMAACPTALADQHCVGDDAIIVESEQR